MHSTKHRLTNFHRLLLIGVVHVVRHPRRILWICILAVAACAAFSFSRLRMSTNQDDLFSSNVPFFRDYIEFTKDFPENQASYVVVEPRDPAQPPSTQRWIAIADAITNRLSHEPKYVIAVDSHVPIEQLGTQALLFEDAPQLKQDVSEATDMMALARRWGEAPGFLDRTVFGNTPMERFLSYVQFRANDVQTAEFTQLLVDGWNKALVNVHQPIRVGDQVPDLEKFGATDPERLGYYYVPNADPDDPAKHLLLVRVYGRIDHSSMAAYTDVIDGIRNAVHEAAKAFPEFTVGLTGRPVLEADEMVTTDRDSHRAEIAALIAIFVGLVLLLRSIWLAVAAEIALLIGIGWTFGWATVSTMPFTGQCHGELNLLSMVFLIALIGIGMDYLIQVLSRYRREAARHSNTQVIWVGVFKYVAAPINTACMGAAGAFLVSVFTNFRGAAELGVIASGGLLLCLATGYIVLPALLTLFPARVRPLPPDFDRPAINLDSQRSHHFWLILPGIWAILLLAGVPFARKAHFDPNLLNMQAKNLQSVKLVQKLQTWSAVVLCKDLNTLGRVRSAVENLPTVESTDSILQAYDNYDWLQKHADLIPRIDWSPPTPIQASDLPKLAGTARALARKTSDSSTTQGSAFASTAASLELFAKTLDSLSGPSAELAAAQLTAWQNVFVSELKNILQVFHPSPLNISKLPKTLRDHLIGQDGRYALYISPKEDLWTQANLAAFVHQVEVAVASVPDAPAPTGIAINIYHSTSSIEESFYHATAYALTLIFILVLIDLRNLRQTLLAISVLAMGLPMLVALMGLLNVPWNFANFFGLPILIGAGHEYGVFMVHRYNEACADPRRMWQKWDVSDRALLLCAFVTTASFGFFWALAHHQGLKSLGLVMALGIACIYLATLCMLRPLLLWKLATRPPSWKNANIAQH